MLTAIYVYQDTYLHFQTCESNLQLARMSSGSVPLASGPGGQSVEPGVYKIVSSQRVEITGENSAFELAVNPSIKTDGPTIPPLAAQNLGTWTADQAALREFFSESDAKHIANP